jgi:hypothetical protein
MQGKIGKIWIVTLTDGRHFAAKMTEIRGDTLVFENSHGETSFNNIADIYRLKEYVPYGKHQEL